MTFNINLSDKDYLDYNVFWMLKSPYGKKQITSSRVMITVLFGIIALVALFINDFSAEALIGLIPVAVVFLIIQLSLNYFFVQSIKSNIKILKKSGKMPYSPVAQVEFNENSFTETTPENKVEQKYSAVERVSVINGDTVYIHVNNVMAYILPATCFESTEQLDGFLSFIKTKCSVIDIY